MEIKPHVDVDVVAVEDDDEVTVMLELVAPSAEASGPRPTASPGRPRRLHRPCA